MLQRLSLVLFGLAVAILLAGLLAWAIGGFRARPDLSAPDGELAGLWLAPDAPVGTLRAGSADAPLLIVRESIEQISDGFFGPGYADRRALIADSKLQVRFVPLGDPSLPLYRMAVCAEPEAAWRLLEWAAANPEDRVADMDRALLADLLTYKGFDAQPVLACAEKEASARIERINANDPYGRLPRYGRASGDFPPGVTIAEALDRIVRPTPPESSPSPDPDSSPDTSPAPSSSP